MRRLFLFLFLLVLIGPVGAQDQVLATSGGYQLRQSDVLPSLELLQFLVQSELSEGDIESVVLEAVNEFQNNPPDLLQSMRDLNTAIEQARVTNDPLVLGELRQRIISEFYQAAQTPAGDTAYLKVLFQKAPVVAYDPRTRVALTQPDLRASLQYLNTLNTLRENEIPPEMMARAGPELIANFGTLEPEMQKLLASGTILLSIFQGNMQAMTPQQQSQTQSHYRTTVGGPPNKTRGDAAQALSREGLRNHTEMMSSIKASGGTDDYWKLTAVP